MPPLWPNLMITIRETKKKPEELEECQEKNSFQLCILFLEASQVQVSGMKRSQNHLRKSACKFCLPKECLKDSHPCWGKSPTWEQGSVLPVLKVKAVPSCCENVSSPLQHVAPLLRMKPLLLALEQGRKFIYISNSCWSSFTAIYSPLLCHKDKIVLRPQFYPYWSNLTSSPNKNCSGNKKKRSKENQAHLLLQHQAWTMNTPLGISEEKKEVLSTASQLQLPYQK